MHDDHYYEGDDKDGHHYYESDDIGDVDDDV